MGRTGSIASSGLACAAAWIAIAAPPAAAVPGDPFDLRSACRIAVGEEPRAEDEHGPIRTVPGPGTHHFR